MLHLKLKEDQREEGFTLIELLVVVVIIGILAAIAIPAFLGQRENAWRSSVQSDIRNVATQVETEYSDSTVTDYATAWSKATDGDSDNFYPVGDNVLEYDDSVSNGFCITGANKNLDTTIADGDISTASEPYFIDMSSGASGMANVEEGSC